MLFCVEVDESVVLNGEELVVVVGGNEVVRLDEGGLVAHGHLVVPNLEASLNIFKILIVFIPYFPHKIQINSLIFLIFPKIILSNPISFSEISLVFVPNFFGNSTSHPL